MAYSQSNSVLFMWIVFKILMILYLCTWIHFNLKFSVFFLYCCCFLGWFDFFIISFFFFKSDQSVWRHGFKFQFEISVYFILSAYGVFLSVWIIVGFRCCWLLRDFNGPKNVKQLYLVLKRFISHSIYLLWKLIWSTINI